MRHVTYILLQILILVSPSITAQMKLSDNGGIVSEDGYTEDITLITDRTVFIAGEKIWFSARLDCEAWYGQECLSRILYIDLYSGINSHFEGQKMKLTEGIAEGSITIPRDFPTGNYFIRAYTNYQKNYLEEDLCLQEILILNPGLPLRGSIHDTPAEILFDGGKACYNTLNKGILLIHKNRDNIASAFLMSELSDTVSIVEFVESGLGIFEFIPSDKHQYHIRIDFESGDPMNLPIRDIHEKGLKLSTTRQDGSLIITLHGSGIEGTGTPQILIVDQYMRKIYADTFTDGLQIVLPAKISGQGMKYLLIRNERGEIIAFRSVYNPEVETIPLEIVTEKYKYASREHVELRVKGIKEADDPVEWLTISVIPEGSSHSSGSHHLHDRYNEVREILHENSILRNKTSLDKLLNSDRGLPFQQLPDIRDISISGMVRQKNTGEPVGQCEVYMSALGHESQLHITRTNDQGEFIFSANDFTGTRKFYVGVDYRRYRNTEILIHKDFIPPYIPPYQSLYFSEASHDLYEQLYINSQLEARSVVKDTSSPGSLFIPQPLFTHPDVSVVPDDYIELSSIQEIFDEIVPLAFLRNKRDSFYFQLKDPVTDQILSDPLVLIDNVPLFDPAALHGLSPNSINRIDIIHQEYLLGGYTFNGMIHIVSKENQLEQLNFPGGSAFFNYLTLTPPAKYTPPGSSGEHTTKLNEPVFTNLLYWDGNLYMRNSPLSIRFRTSDAFSVYRIIVEGITSDGASCHGETTIRVGENQGIIP